jgi:sulfur dioxygenase
MSLNEAEKFPIFRQVNKRFFCNHIFDVVTYFLIKLFDSESSTYTYIVGDPISKDAIIIDPVLEKVDRDIEVIKEMGLNLKFALNTHAHADHITGSGLIKKLTNHEVKSVIGKRSSAIADIHLEDGDLFTFGNQTLNCLSTPGHTNGCFTFVSRNGKMIFTGDCVLIRGCGRTDFQGNKALRYVNHFKDLFA